jgi:hypothetical protein
MPYLARKTENDKRRGRPKSGKRVEINLVSRFSANN